MNISRLVVLSVLLFFSAWGTTRAENKLDYISPRETLIALDILFNNAQLDIPRDSSCYGHYAEDREPRIRDVLTAALASFVDGRNIVYGGCDHGACRITMTHANGEDVSSTTIYFHLDEDNQSIGYFECVITP